MKANLSLKPLEPSMRLVFILPVTVFCGLGALINFSVASAAGPSRQAEVSARGAQVMPFDLKETTHLFTKTNDGGIQQVVAKNPQNRMQIKLIREHLQEISNQFGKGDFSAPMQIHGAEMPGLKELKKARPGEILINYKALSDGGEVEYSTSNATLVAALHRWFDAQLSDHGADAKQGHAHHSMMHE
ncbi:MAG: aspartate carbamoyltransferase [Herbaspirillum sp.]